MESVSKVVLTKEQVDAIEKRKLYFNDSDERLIDFQYHIHSDSNTDDTKYCNDSECLNDISPIDLAKALLIGYEIEQPKFEVGDIVTHVKGAFKGAKSLIFVGEDLVKIKGEEVTLFLLENIRHATKEEIFWAELGREVGEFREGDVRIKHNGDAIVVCNEDYANEHYKKGNLKGFYPSNSFKPFPTGN